MGEYVGMKHHDLVGKLLILLFIRLTYAWEGPCWVDISRSGRVLDATTQEPGVTFPYIFRMCRNGTLTRSCPLRSSRWPSYAWFSNKTLLQSTEQPTRALSQLCPPQSTPTTTHKVPEVLAAAESGSSSPEQWKNKLLKGLFPCSEYFYKANPQGLSPHTQLFLSFLTRSPRWALGDGKWRQGGGSCSWLGVRQVFRESRDVVWPQNISGGGCGGEVEAISPLSGGEGAYSSSVTNRSPNPLPSQSTGAAKGNEAGSSPPSKPLCHGFRPQTRGPSLVLHHMLGLGHDSAKQTPVSSPTLTRAWARWGWWAGG